MSIFYDGQPGPEVREQLNALYAAFSDSAYPPTAGMFAPGTLSAPSVRGTADPSTGWNFVDGEAQLSVGGALKARATAAGLLDALGNPLLSAANAVGLLSQGAWCQVDRTAAGDVYRYADGRMHVEVPVTWGAGEALGDASGLGGEGKSVVPPVIPIGIFSVSCHIQRYSPSYAPWAMQLFIAYEQRPSDVLVWPALRAATAAGVLAESLHATIIFEGRWKA